MKTLELITSLGIVISILLSIIAYFLKQLHGNFRKMENDMAVVKANIQLMKAELKANYNLLRQRMDFLERKH
ncbi:hypothetical protein [Olivibacter domesticus]|uniref:Uncharacterized protein n=1 Tax=Olivibacter domesticus TaxID=407022 RepID=A0A1H7KHA7_OLID1|nr:hypothetical protein [Olivibacter domesticus]SEK86169.1 hypothetical protein SAMN05661044_01353 [Olivibacter domesticus]